MGVQNITIQDGTPEDVVQFMKHIEENVAADGSVSITTVTQDESVLPGDTVNMGWLDGPPERAEYGVKFEVSFDTHSEHPSNLLELSESFYGDGNVAFHEEYDGEIGEYEAYIFESGV